MKQHSLPIPPTNTTRLAALVAQRCHQSAAERFQHFITGERTTEILEDFEGIIFDSACKDVSLDALLQVLPFFYRVQYLFCVFPFFIFQIHSKQ